MPHEGMDRREFLRALGRCGVALGGAGLLLADPGALARLVGDAGRGDARAAAVLEELIRQAPRARFWTSTRLAGGDCQACHRPGETGGRTEFDHGEVLIRCQLCANSCTIGEGQRGRCQARIHVDGELRTLVYGRPISIHVDPIEKKPFYHFLPGSEVFSLATSGCALHCRFCQNWEISQARPEDYDTPFVAPERIAAESARRRAPVIAFTYNEPTIFAEYLLDIARAGRRQGLRSVLISCGFMQEAPLAEMCEALDAIKIDLKGFSPEFYRDVCQAELAPVLRSIAQAARCGVHLELVNLVVPTLNDSDAMLTGLARWVMDEVGPDVPVHFTRFHPDYQLLNLPPTPVETLERARAIAMDLGIRYAFVGNVPGHPGNHTYCPRCGETVIERRGFLVTRQKLAGGRCAACGQEIAGVWR
jgi:pyruvate formate lyase activating enzyme